MIKKSTLLVLLGAIILGAAFYYFDWRRAQKEAEAGIVDASKAAFVIPAAADINSLTLTHPAATEEPAIHLEKRGGVWQILQPMQTDADENVAGQLSTALAAARIAETEPGTPDRLKAFGLDPPAVTIEFQLQSGAKHSVKLGDKDFSGASVYAILDSAKDVVLLPYSLLVSANQKLTDFRNHAILAITTPEVASFVLKNSSGELAASKDKSDWKFTKPAGEMADTADVNGLLGALAAARWTVIESETPENLAKFGLANPSITFTALDGKGTSFTLLVGKKEGNDYLARDASRPMVFHISDDLHKKLAQSYSDLRDKKVAHFNSADLTRLELRNSNATIIATRKPGKEDEWTVEAPDYVKGKSAATWKLFSALTTARAEEVLDHPSPEILAKLAKPEIEVILTSQDGKALTVQITKEAGDFVYARASDRPAVYKLKKGLTAGLNLKPSDFVF